MKKRILPMVLALLVIIAFSGCGNTALEAAQVAASAYNEAVDAYGEATAPYNEAVRQVSDANQALEDATDTAQAAINAGQTPYAPETLAALKSAISAGQDAKIAVPEALPVYEILTVEENAETDALKTLAAQAEADVAALEAFTAPTPPKIPDYTQTIVAILTSLEAYNQSTQILKQVTAPSDAFIMDRLGAVDTILEIDAVTEDHDPNGKLNKQGGYIGCIYFSDSQVDKAQLYIEAGKDNVIDIGTDGGGAIEIFSNAADAVVRNEYLAGFDGTMFASGSHYLVGTCIIRTSNILSGTQQLELTEKITNVLLEVKH